jgi:hypothetical protein
MFTVANLTPVGSMTLNAVGNRAAGTGLCQFVRGPGSGNRLDTMTGTANTWRATATAAITSTAGTDAAWHSGTAVINGASSVLRVDGTEVTGTLTLVLTAAAVAIQGADTTTCRQSEMVLWNNYSLTPAERTALQTTQKNFWGTP